MGADSHSLSARNHLPCGNNGVLNVKTPQERAKHVYDLVYHI